MNPNQQAILNNVIKDLKQSGMEYLQGADWSIAWHYKDNRWQDYWTKGIELLAMADIIKISVQYTLENNNV